MRVVRYLLQGAILLFGVAVLVALALSPQFALLPFLGFAAFFAFLLFLTVLLREHTESRIRVGRKVNPKFIAVFLALVGVGICWVSASILNGNTGTSAGRGSLLRVAIEFFGPWPATVLLLVTGLFILWLAYGLLRQR